MQVLAQFREFIANRQATAVAGYEDLVTKLAAGKIVKPEAIANVLAAAGKTPAGLEADIRRITERRRQQAVISRAEAADKELGPLTAALADTERRKEAAAAAFDPEINRLAERLHEARELAMQGMEARRALLCELAVSAVDDQRLPIRSRITQLEESIPMALDTASRLRGQAERLRKAWFKYTADKEASDDQASALDARANELEAELDGRRQEIDRLKQAECDLDEKLVQA